MVVVIDGDQTCEELDLHHALAGWLEFGEHYGWHLAALWDWLSTDVPRPVTLIWRRSGISRQNLGDEQFGRIVSLLKDVAAQDTAWDLEDRFEVVFE